jgi:hypothetical protein
MSSRPAFVAGLGVTFGLLVAMLAYALANGAFGTPPADRVGTFEEINARVARHTPRTTTTVVAPTTRTTPRPTAVTPRSTRGDDPETAIPGAPNATSPAGDEPDPTNPTTAAPHAVAPAPMPTGSPTTAGRRDKHERPGDDGPGGSRGDDDADD